MESKKLDVINHQIFLNKRITYLRTGSDEHVRDTVIDTFGKTTGKYKECYIIKEDDNTFIGCSHKKCI